MLFAVVFHFFGVNFDAAEVLKIIKQSLLYIF